MSGGKGLGAVAVERLLGCGVSPAEWMRFHGHGDVWGGDSCGCPDDRCIGSHHASDESCNCVWALLQLFLAVRDENAFVGPVMPVEGRRESNEALAGLRVGQGLSIQNQSITEGTRSMNIISNGQDSTADRAMRGGDERLTLSLNGPVPVESSVDAETRTFSLPLFRLVLDPENEVVSGEFYSVRGPESVMGGATRRLAEAKFNDLVCGDVSTDDWQHDRSTGLYSWMEVQSGDVFECDAPGCRFFGGLHEDCIWFGEHEADVMVSKLMVDCQVAIGWYEDAREWRSDGAGWDGCSTTATRERSEALLEAAGLLDRLNERVRLADRGE